MEFRLLQGVAEDDVRRLLTMARARRFARGEVVFHRDDPADTVHLIQQGHFAVRINTRGGHTAMLAVLGPGDVFGELALITDSARSATVAALDPATTWSVHRLDFDRLRREHPSVGEIVGVILANQVRRLSDQLVDALYVPAEERLLGRLAEVAAIYAADDPVEVPITQDDLATMVGTSRATVNRVLNERERLGQVTLQRGRIVINDRGALRRR